ncbi:biotin-dependent carboxyltransferase family protein [Flavobacteriaceae bacterium]|nr:biotin-dependent carboxyltransferase family protein [Flavobacteriaceae bacterium]|tara:strand:- start:4825 stop:5658 length:834 start_codon:yes stop_codon:yes gene_type:complete
MIKVIQPGLFTTIQDGGRHGYRNIGIPTSGFMDQESAWAANKIVDNDREESLIEITLKGPTLLFNNNCTISITGGDFNPLINGMPIKMYESINVKLGDTLKINNTKNGARCYLAISGGIDVKSIFGSKSFLSNITESYYLRKGDEIKISDNFNNKILKKNKLKFKLNRSMDVFKGPEFDLLSIKVKNILFENEFTIRSNSRMAYNLDEKAQIGIKSIISSPVMPGSVQLTPSGKMIILHRDCQTIGGYPRILQLDTNSLNNLSQLKSNDKIKFSLIS